jgi:hypothetical protein
MLSIQFGNTKKRGIMERNKDLIKELLVYLELKTDGHTPIQAADIRISNYTTTEIVYHLHLLLDKKYIEARIAGVSISVTRLTYDGHDFLDTIRNDPD